MGLPSNYCRPPASPICHARPITESSGWNCWSLPRAWPGVARWRGRVLQPMLGPKWPWSRISTRLRARQLPPPVHHIELLPDWGQGLPLTYRRRSAPSTITLAKTPFAQSPDSQAYAVNNSIISLFTIRAEACTSVLARQVKRNVFIEAQLVQDLLHPSKSFAAVSKGPYPLNPAAWT